MLVCAAYHHHLFSPSKSRIWVLTKDVPLVITALTCKQCIKPACMLHCPVNAIEKRNGVVIVDDKKCIGCAVCVEKCPFGTIYIDADTHVAAKCDLCDGAPKCVEACVPEALSIRD
jgi:Fe-S-cluster-containing hydrogenase component 2